MIHIKSSRLYKVSYRAGDMVVMFVQTRYFVRAVVVYAQNKRIATRLTFHTGSNRRAVFEAENALRLKNWELGRLLNVEALT